MNQRIYKVTNTKSETYSLVEATSQAAAIKHVASGLFSAKVAKQSDFVQAMNDGQQVEKAKADVAEDAQPMLPGFEEELQGDQAEENKGE